MPFHRIPCRLSLIALAVCLLSPSSARSEVFFLTQGGSLHGKLLNPDQKPRENYIVRSPLGAVVTLSGEQVREVVVKSPAEKRYEEILPKMPRTVDGLWKMCEWCRESDLPEQRRVHLQQLLKLDPDHQGARLALGYSKIDGKWIRTDDYMREQGYVRFQGSWRLPQEVALESQEENVEERENEWRRTVKIWRSQLGRRLGPEAIDNLRNIDDPFAAPAVADELHEEPDRNLKRIYIRVLGRLATPKAVSALAKQALEDRDSRTRDDCLDQLVKLKSRRAAAIFMTALGSKDRIQINNAAVGLARLGHRPAIAPLIDVLVTRQKYKLVSGSPGGLGTSFNKDGGLGGLSAGSSTKIVERDEANEAVRQALVVLTGANYGFDKSAWERWYAAKHAPRRFDLRRDE